MLRKVFIIAEAGVNHNGSTAIAKKLIDTAVWAGADAVKFQTFIAESLAIRNATMAAYQKKAVGDISQYKLLKSVELPADAYGKLMSYSKKKGIIFISSPFDLQSIALLSKLGLEFFKIPSGEITNLPYLRKIGALNKKIILSTGMANLEEIGNALNILISSGTKKPNITILHCNTAYPTPVIDVNLKAMLTIKDKLKVQVGYSDHTLGIEVSIAAVALGAVVIEKHFTLDKKMSGPDHKSSIDSKELKKMVEAIRNIEKALGTGFKEPSKSEVGNIVAVRKSIVAVKDIKKGEAFTDENITVKRPGTGLNPMMWNNVIGKVSKQDFRQDELIRL